MTPTLPRTSGGGCSACGTIREQYDEYSSRRRIPSDICDHLPELFQWTRGWPPAEDGSNTNVIELGVRSGNSTSAFLAALELDGRGTLWSVDIAKPDVPPHWHDLDYWQFLQADALGARARSWLPQQCRVLFVDLDPHSYAQTLEACQVYVPRVQYGGVALFHDTDPAHSSDVARALDEYCRVTTGVEWHNRPGNHGLGIMRVR